MEKGRRTSQEKLSEWYKITKVNKQYEDFRDTILRQFGEKEYTDRWEEDMVGETSFFNLLDSTQKEELKKIEKRLEGMLNTVKNKLLPQEK